MRLFAKIVLPILAVLACSSVADAMELNMALPWNPEASGNVQPPNRDPRFAFYSAQSDTLLFSDQKEIVIDCRSGLRSVGLTWALTRNMFEKPFLTGEAEALPANTFRIHIPVDKLKPGFFDIHVTLDAGEAKPCLGKCTFGYKVDDMPITKDMPADFKAFWDKGKEELAKIPVDAKVEAFQTFKGKEIDAYNETSAAIPGDYDPKGHRTEEVESAKMDFAGMGNIRVHGWLAKPTGNGPFPAMLILPGAGFNARSRPLEHARHGFVALDIQVHGQEVDLPGEYPKLPGYYGDFIYEPPQAYYFYHVYLNCIQAVNYLESRPDVDKTRIVVVGGSQGGRLSVCLAGLDPRLAAAVPAIAHNANLPYDKWFQAANKAKPQQDGMDLDAPPVLPDTPECKCLAYYDDINFAPDIHCPVFMNAGLIDPISPPSATFAIYNLLGTKDKTITPLPGLGHDWSAEFDRRAWRFLDRVLKLPPVAPAAPAPQ
jgi:cephalosporin-C deacetylase